MRKGDCICIWWSYENRGRPVANVEVIEEMRNLQARLEAMEVSQRRGVDLGDVSEEEEVAEVEEGAEPEEEGVEEKLIRAIMGVSSRPRMEVPLYEGNLNVDELMDWISTLDKYFEYENVPDEKKVKFVVTRMKGHALLWWDGVQAERQNKGKTRIKSWDRMVAKLKGKFMPRDYQLNIFRQMQNLKQRGMSVKEYTEEFYKLNIRVGHIEENLRKVARYLNGLRYEIQDEIGILSPNTIEEAYQFSLKEEEKLARKQNQRSKRSQFNKRQRTTRWQRKIFSSKRKKPTTHINKNNHQEVVISEGEDLIKEVGDLLSDVLDAISLGIDHMNVQKMLPPSRGSANVVQEEEESVESYVHENAPEVGESLMMKRILLKPHKEIKEPAQRKTLFRTVCKSKGKCCKVIIDSGSTDNLVSTEMVEKLALKKTTHPVPYKVSWLAKGTSVDSE
jgi:predicted DsbA family dithiol-disulfide isomerase